MKLQRFALAITIVNLALLVFLLGQLRPAGAQGAPAVLRGRSLEIVDATGEVRANIKIEPAVKGTDGKTYPESVVLRLRDERGQIRVKLGADAEGSGLLLANDSQQPGVHMLAKTDGSTLKLTDKNGREQIVKP